VDCNFDVRVFFIFLQFIKQYDDEDLMEIVLPRLARVMTVWEFVLMKVCSDVLEHGIDFLILSFISHC